MDQNHHKAFEAFIKSLKERSPIVQVALTLGCIDQKAVHGGHYRGNCATGHASASGTCFVIDGVKGLCHCFSCDFGGDVIKLVQRTKFGEVSSKTFMPAVRYLAQTAGMKLPGMTDAEWKRHELELAEFDRAKKVLTKAADIFHRDLPYNQRSFTHRRYGFTDATIDTFSIGYAQPGNLLGGLRREGFSDEDLLLSGLFRLGPAGPEERFVHRLMFPYRRHGEAVYFIGRKTEHTPQLEWEEGKYKKLKIFGAKASYIAKGIKNDMIFNQQAALGADKVVITEGIADCIALHQHGFAAISPVTVRFSKQDQDNVLQLLRKGQTVYISNDNDTNEAGEKGALSMARHLARHGFSVKLINIPLLEVHRDARKRLEVLEG